MWYLKKVYCLLLALLELIVRTFRQLGCCTSSMMCKILQSLAWDMIWEVFICHLCIQWRPHEWDGIWMQSSSKWNALDGTRNHNHIQIMTCQCGCVYEGHKALQEWWPIYWFLTVLPITAKPAMLQNHQRDVQFSLALNWASHQETHSQSYRNHRHKSQSIPSGVKLTTWKLSILMKRS